MICASRAFQRWSVLSLIAVAAALLATPSAAAEQVRELLTLRGDLQMLWADFSPDGKLIATASGSMGDGARAKLQIWDAATGKLLRTLPGHAQAVTRGSFNPKNSQSLATASWDGTVILWNVETGERQWSVKASNIKAANVAFSPDGSMLAVTAADGTVKLLDAANGGAKKEFKPHGDGAVNGVAFLPDGKRIASSGGDNRVRVWVLAAGPKEYEWEIETPFAFDVAVSPDGKNVAAPSKFEGCTVWSVETGEKLRDFDVEGPIPFSVAFSPDGSRLAVASGEPDEAGEIKIWDAESGKLIHDLGGHDGAVYFVRFDREGQRLISASEDKTVKVWSLGDPPAGAEAKAAPAPAADDEFQLSRLFNKHKTSDEVQEVAKPLPEPEVSEYDDCAYWSWKPHGLSIRFDERGNVSTLFLYDEGVDNYEAYRDSLPAGLKLGMTRTEVEAKLGKPDRVWGGGVLTVRAEFPNGLSVHYQTNDQNDMQAKIGVVSLLRPSE